MTTTGIESSEGLRRAGSARGLADDGGESRREPTTVRAPRGGLLLSAASIGVGILNYGYTLLVARYLPQAAYASFAACQTIILLSNTVATAAIPWLLAREIARSPDDDPARRSVFRFAVTANLILGLISAVIGCGIAVIFAAPAVVTLVGVAIVGNFLISTGLGWAQGYSRFGMYAAIQVCQVTIKVVCGLLLIHFGLGVTGALAGNALAVVVLVIVGAGALRGELPRSSRARYRSGPLWRQALSMAGLQATSTYLGSVDVLSSVVVIPITADTGSYSFANALGRVPTFLAAALATATFPTLLSSSRLRWDVRHSFGRLLIVCAPISAGLATVPHRFLDLLVSHKYMEVATYLPFVAINGLGSAVLIMQLNYMKAAPRHARGLRASALVCVVVSGAMTVAAREFGVLGIAVAAAAQVWIAAALLAVLAGGPLADIRPHRGQAVGIVAACLAIYLCHWLTWVWLPVTIAVSVASAVVGMTSWRPTSLGGRLA